MSVADVVAGEGESRRPGAAVAVAAAVGAVGAVVLVVLLVLLYLVLAVTVGLTDAVTGGSHPGDGWAYALSVSRYPLASVGLAVLVAWLWARSPGAGSLSPWFVGVVSGLAGFAVAGAWLLAG